MITILNYGEGNIASVQNAFQYLGQKTLVTDHIDDIKKASVLVVPGQGAFKQVMSQLQKKKLVDVIQQHLLSGKKFFGICLGFQILFDGSEEHEFTKGLSYFKGTFFRFKSDDIKVPHMGWNICSVKGQSEMFKGCKYPIYTYFVHSYRVDSVYNDIVSSTTQHGEQFVSAVQYKNIWATQFHPEKSGDIGMQILTNFLKS